MLLAGKYLNVIRECGIEISRDPDSTDDEEFSMEDDKYVAGVLPKVYLAHRIRARFYKSIDEAYAHANRTLLQLLLRDQQLMPRLRSLKRFFFLSQSSFLTHLLDLSQSELRKQAKSASLVKLQSLLDLALNTDTQGEDAMFREDVRVTMAGSGLYEWLLKVVTVNGVIGGEDGDRGQAYEESKKEREKEKDDKKQLLGKSIRLRTQRVMLMFPQQLLTRWRWTTTSNFRYRLSFHAGPFSDISSSSAFCSISNTSSNLSHPCGSNTRHRLGAVRHVHLRVALRRLHRHRPMTGILISRTGANACSSFVHACSRLFNRYWHFAHSRCSNPTGVSWKRNSGPARSRQSTSFCETTSTFWTPVSKNAC